MTPPDSLEKNRNFLALVSVSLVATSFGTAFAANFWQAIMDYWLVWASFVAGLGGAVSIIATVVLHLCYTEALRSN